MTRTVFFAFGAYVGSITGPRTCLWWPADPSTLGWDATLAISTDLGATPAAAAAGTIGAADVQCDDHRIDGGLTSVGPLFPGGATIGAIWLAEPFYASLGDNQPPRQPGSAPFPCRDYELQENVYWGNDPAGDRRFYGFHAEIVAPPQGGLVLVDLWNAGTSLVAGMPPAGRWWIDLATSSDSSSTTIAIGGAQQGALFLEATLAQTLALRGPKRPPNLGTVSYSDPR